MCRKNEIRGCARKMLKVKLREKNDDSITFRIPKSLKLKLPGAYLDKTDDRVKFEDGHAIGNLLRDLIDIYVNDNVNKDYKILKNGAIELLKLMKIVKPTRAQMLKVRLTDIDRLKEVL